MLNVSMRRLIAASCVAAAVGAATGCEQAAGPEPALPTASAPPPEPKKGGNDPKASSPLGGSATSADPNPGAKR
jgi:hypothetical protein